MSRHALQKLFTLFIIFIILWAGMRWIFPLIFPFLLAFGLALAAEPMCGFLVKKMKFPRGPAAGISVTAALILLLKLFLLAAALALRELEVLAGAVPDLEKAARDGLSLLEARLTALATGSPAGIRPLLQACIADLFSSSSSVVSRIGSRLLSLASSALWKLPDSALTFFTAILAAFMISARLPRIRQWFSGRISPQWRDRYMPVLQNIRRAVGGWIQAQLRLSGITLLITALGLTLLGIPYAPVLALLIALVDAVPLLGTGTVLIPWSLICLMQRQQLRGLGLLGIYAAAALTRSGLEPRLLGSRLGLDPLMTLAALYAGCRLWGLGGMILSPLLAVVTVQLAGADFFPLNPRKKSVQP